MNKLVDKLTQKQFELRCEKAMSSIALVNRDQYLKETEKLLLIFLMNEKNHFLRFYDIVTDLNSNNSQIESPKSQINDVKKIQQSSIKNFSITSLEFFCQKLVENKCSKYVKNKNNYEFLSTLAFSLFPSISTFFHMNILPNKVKSRTSSFDYQKLNFNKVFYLLSQDENFESRDFQDLFNLLMKPMFCSPLFIYFCQNFFQPIFSQIQNEQIEKNFSLSEFLSYHVEKRFEVTLHLVPSYVALNLKLSPNPYRTVLESFFDIALKTPESSQYFCLFHYSKPPSVELLSSIRKSLLEENSFIKYFTDKIISAGEQIRLQMSKPNPTKPTCSAPELKHPKKVGNHYITIEDSERIDLAMQMKNFFFEEDSFIFGSGFLEKTILSGRDIKVLEYLYKTDGNLDFNSWLTQDFSTNNYQWFYFYQNRMDSLSNPLIRSMPNSADEIAPNLRHLLQNSDPIPKFRKFPEDLNVEQFFEKYLVKRGPIDSLSKRKIYHKNIFNIFNKHDDDDRKIQAIEDTLPFTNYVQTKLIEEMTNSTIMRKKISACIDIISSIRMSIDLMDSIIILKENEKSWKDLLLFHTNSEYIENLSLLPKDFFHNFYHLNLNLFKN